MDRVEQHRSPDPVQDRVEAPGVVVEGRHDGVGAERARRLRARVAADQRRDVRAAGDGELHRERADPAGRARDEDAPAEQVPALAQRAQRVSPATGSAAASANSTSAGSAATRWLGTSARCAQPPPSAMPTTRVPGARAAAVGGGLRHDAREVLARLPAVGALLEQAQLAAVDGVRAHVDEDVVRAGLRCGQLAAVEAAGAAGSVT